MFPDWWLGRPADAGAEWDDQALRGPESVRFPQATAECADVSWETCRESVMVDDCQCMTMHASPYPDPEVPPVEIVRTALGVEFPRVLGVTGAMTGYMVPPADWSRITLRPVEEMFGLGYILQTVDYLGETKDHYEETVAFGPAVVERCEAGLAAMAATFTP